jgi:predicted transcriptional regulator
MPIEIQRDTDETIDVKPRTNEATVLAYLVKHPQTAFRQVELSNATGVSRSSVYKTVERLIEKGLVEWYVDREHVHINRDRRESIYKRLRSFRDAETFERLFEDDYFAENLDWADDIPDMGKEPLPESRPPGTARWEDERGLDKIAELPDMDE